MHPDPANGYERQAQAFMAARSGIGTGTVRAWASRLPPGCAILDVGAGHGAPLAQALAGDGFAIHAVEPSPTLAAAFAQRLPHAVIACEEAEESSFFSRRFHGVMAIGVLFLLEAETQRALLPRLAAVLEPGGSLLFTAPAPACTWSDVLTARPSRSLGAEAYLQLLADAGLICAAPVTDEGGNCYFEARRPLPIIPPSGN